MKTRNRQSDTYIDVKGYMKNDILHTVRNVVFMSALSSSISEQREKATRDRDSRLSLIN